MQVERAKEVYKMVQKYNIKGCPEVYTIAINSCSQTGDWEFAHTVYNDMTQKGILPDEVPFFFEKMFLIWNYVLLKSFSFSGF